ncbi:MAG: Ldh family oxidoreductase [Leisingera sp.]
MTVSIDLGTLSGFLNRCFRAGGFSASNASVVTDHLIDAEMRGMRSHGINRLGWYLSLVRDGELDGQATPEISQVAQSVLLCDGRGGIGITAMQHATDAAVASARESFVAVAGVRNCGHTGRLGAYAETAAKAGCFAITLGGGGRDKWASVVPFGGTEPVMSTNPYALALPDGKDGAVACDFAISTIATGKVAVAQANGQQLPKGAVVDAAGNPTRNPDDFYSGGALLPAAGPKGSGLGLIAELAGAAMMGTPMEFNWLLVCIRADAFQSMGQFSQEAQALCSQVRGGQPAAGFGKVRMPGDLENESYLSCQQRGAVEIEDGVANGLRSAAESVGQPAWD